MDNQNRIGYSALVIVFIIAFLLGYGTSSQIVNRPSDGLGMEEQSEESQEEERAGQETAAETEPSPESSLTQVPLMLGAGINTISAENQPAGKSVSVAVKTDKEVWVAVHEDMAGKPGKILGAQLFAAGTHSGKVDLLRGTVAGMKYYAMLHSDDGDRKFDHTKDRPLVNAAGAAITDDFTATVAASIQ